MVPVRISAVSYLNTKPFLYGLFQSGMDKQCALSLDIPSECARKLIEGEVDLGLVPVAVIPQLGDAATVVSDYCIGTLGEVKTVCIYSQVPIEEVTELYLDYHSRTSAALTRYLLQDYWQVQPRLLPAQPGYEQRLKGSTAGLIIGDRTIGLEGRYAYRYDLGGIWQAHTGLPFVFAAWVSREPLPAAFLEPFNRALGQGVQQRHQVAQLFESSHPHFSVHEYYHRYIDYDLTPEKRQALALFLEQVRQQPQLARQRV